LVAFKLEYCHELSSLILGATYVIAEGQVPGKEMKDEQTQR